jgi:ligand-binding sensor domain-containing protein
MPVWSLQIGTPKGTLYVGADKGVYATTNFGASWSRFGAGLPHAQVFQIELNRNLHILGAGTHGRGMWEIATP